MAIQPFARTLDLCKWEDFDGYGFVLNGIKGRVGHTVDSVDPSGPAYAGGMRDRDLVIEVNGYHITSDPHLEVVDRICSQPDHVRLLVVDPVSKEWFDQNRILIDSHMRELQHLKCPLSRPTPVVAENGSRLDDPLTSDAFGNRDKLPEHAGAAPMNSKHMSPSASPAATFTLPTYPDPTPNSTKQDDIISPGPILGNLTNGHNSETEGGGSTEVVLRGGIHEDDQRCASSHASIPKECFDELLGKTSKLDTEQTVHPPLHNITEGGDFEINHSFPIIEEESTKADSSVPVLKHETAGHTSRKSSDANEVLRPRDEVDDGVVTTTDSEERAKVSPIHDEVTSDSIPVPSDVPTQLHSDEPLQSSRTCGTKDHTDGDNVVEFNVDHPEAPMEGQSLRNVEYDFATCKSRVSCNRRRGQKPSTSYSHRIIQFHRL